MGGIAKMKINKTRSSVCWEIFKNMVKKQITIGGWVSQDEAGKVRCMPFFRRELELLWLYYQAPLSWSLVPHFSGHTKFCTWQFSPPINTTSQPGGWGNSPWRSDYKAGWASEAMESMGDLSAKPVLHADLQFPHQQVKILIVSIYIKA